MEEERNTNGWSARQLIRQLNESAGSRQSVVGSRQGSVGSPQSAVYSRQFDTPTQEEDQSRTRSFGTPGYQSTVGNTQSATGSSQSAGKYSSAAQPEPGHGSSQKLRPKPTGKKGKGGVFKGLISGTLISESLILKDIRYTALVALLAVIFIANKFNAERVERQIIVLEQEVRDMRAEALSVSADLGSVSRQSEITELVKERGLGLEELREPPYRIVVNE